jgi:hypothetical protein
MIPAAEAHNDKKTFYGDLAVCPVDFAPGQDIGAYMAAFAYGYCDWCCQQRNGI